MIREFTEYMAFLSNFYSSTFSFSGREWPTVEHAFQAHKATNETDYLWVASALTPYDAKKRGRKIVLRNDWDSIKIPLMQNLVYAKFSQNDILKERLLSTNEAHLEEGNTWGDRFWGTVDGVGENHLGKILMAVRSFLRPYHPAVDNTRYLL